MRITPAEITALILSIKVALLSVIVMFPPGLLVGWLLAKREFSRQNLPQYSRDVTIGAATCGEWVFTSYPLR